MSSTNDFDRLLGEFLADGPTHAPDRPVDLAIEHARAHPRRFRALRFLWTDAMVARGAPAALRPVALMAILALALAAVIGGAVLVGSWLTNPAVVVPPPTATPTALPTATPSTAHVETPSPHPTFQAELVDGLGNRKQIAVTDRSGLLVRVESGQASDNPSVEGLEVTALPGGDGLRLRWTFCGNDADYVLTIDEEVRLLTLEHGPCEGDTLPVDHVLELEFSEPVDAADVQGELSER